MMQDYPYARHEAGKFGEVMRRYLGRQSSPPTEIATVVDVSTQLTTGHVTATTLKGPVRVMGVPPNSACPGSQIYVRLLSSRSADAYIFDGFSGTYTNRTTSSGSVITTNGLSTGAGTSATLGATLDSSSPVINLPASSGFYIAFFFSVASLPSPNSNYVLLDLPFLGTSGRTVASGLQILYTSAGQLNAKLYNWPTVGNVQGSPTAEYFAPRHTWWLLAHLNWGMSVNAIQTTSMKSITALTSITTPQAGNYGVFVLGDHTGANMPAAGSWMSKILLGFSSSIPAYASTPQNDSQIITSNTYGKWLCGDSVGQSSLSETSTQTSPHAPLQILSGASIAAGPY